MSHGLKQRNLDTALPFVYLSTHFIQAKEYLEAIVASTSDAICTTDLRGRIIYFSPGAEKLLGLSAQKALGLPVWTFYEGGKAEAERIMKMLFKNHTLADYETAVVHGGRRVPISMSAALLKDRSGKVIGTLGISKNISRRIELESRLRELSITDNLTGLFNQRHFHERLTLEVERAKRQRQKLSLLLLDIDRFKQANDLWGHPEGDRILTDIAEILTRSIRKNVDVAFRYGGDEFVILLPGLGPGLAQRVAQRIESAFSRKPYAKLLGLSIGAATLRPAETAADLLRRADALMYRIKHKRRAQDSDYSNGRPNAGA